MAPIGQNQLTSTPTRGRGQSPGPSRTDSAASGGRDEQSTAHGSSDTLTKRGDEKNQLCDLNNRLATYIENMNRLQSENHRLRETLRRVEEKKTVETTTVKHNFQKQSDSLRAAISEEAKLRATAQADAKNLRTNIERVKAWNATLTEDLDRAALRVNALETENANLRTKYESAAIQGLQKQKELEAARKQAADAENRLKALSIQNATLKKDVDSLNHVNKLMNESHEKQIEEIRQTTESEIVEVSERVQGRAQSSLQSKIDEFRKIYEVKMDEQRALFAKEKERIQSQYVPKQSYEQIKSEAASLAAQVAELKREINEKTNILEQERAWSMELVRNKDRDIQEAYESYRTLKKEHDDLIHVKQSLQRELDVFRLLLEKEECRLNLSGSASSGQYSYTSVPSSSTASPNTSSGVGSGMSSPEVSSSRKRKIASTDFESTERSEKDVETESESFGPIKIEDHDTKGGKFIVLQNTSDKDLPLGRWKVVQQSGEKKAAHRFPLQFTIKANEKITLWSANSGKKHCPPTDYVVKTVVFPWSEAGSVHLSTTIFDPRGKKMAKRVSRVRSFSSGFSHKSQRIDDEDDEEEDSMDDDADLTTVSVDEPSCGLM